MIFLNWFVVNLRGEPEKPNWTRKYREEIAQSNVVTCTWASERGKLCLLNRERHTREAWLWCWVVADWVYFLLVWVKMSTSVFGYCHCGWPSRLPRLCYNKSKKKPNRHKHTYIVMHICALRCQLGHEFAGVLFFLFA